MTQKARDREKPALTLLTVCLLLKSKHQLKRHKLVPPGHEEESTLVQKLVPLTTMQCLQYPGQPAHQHPLGSRLLPQRPPLKQPSVTEKEDERKTPGTQEAENQETNKMSVLPLKHKEDTKPAVPKGGDRELRGWASLGHRRHPESSKSQPGYCSATPLVREGHP